MCSGGGGGGSVVVDVIIRRDARQGKATSGDEPTQFFTNKNKLDKAAHMKCSTSTALVSCGCEYERVG